MDVPIACMTKHISSHVVFSAVGFNKGNQLRVGANGNRHIASVSFLTRMPPYDSLIRMMARLPEFQSFGVVRGRLNRKRSCVLADFLYGIQNRFQSANMR